jgi:hypothetical protein
MKSARSNFIRWVCAFAAVSAAAVAATSASAVTFGGPIPGEVRGPVNEVIPVSDTLKELVAVGRTVVADRALTQFLDQTATGFSFDTPMVLREH